MMTTERDKDVWTSVRLNRKSRDEIRKAAKKMGVSQAVMVANLVDMGLQEWKRDAAQ